MGAFVAKQPNGLLCRFSTIIDCCTHYDMTEQDYIDVCVERAIEKAKEEAKDVLKNYIKDYSMVIDYFSPNNQTYEEFIEEAKSVGANDDMIKLINDNLKEFEEEQYEEDN